MSELRRCCSDRIVRTRQRAADNAQACVQRVAAAEAEAARSYEVVEERDKRLRFLWWKDDLRSMKADEAHTLRFVHAGYAHMRRAVRCDGVGRMLLPERACPALHYCMCGLQLSWCLGFRCLKLFSK